MDQQTYAALSTEDKLAYWKGYHPTTPAMATLKRRSVRYFTDRSNAELREHLAKLAF